MKQIILALGLCLIGGTAWAAVDYTGSTPPANSDVCSANALGNLSSCASLTQNLVSAQVDGGTTFTIAVSGSGCTVGTATGGSATGKFTATSGGTCTYVLTLGGATSVSGWAGTLTDITTTADALHLTASTTTTMTFTGAVATNDVLVLEAKGF